MHTLVIFDPAKVDPPATAGGTDSLQVAFSDCEAIIQAARGL